MPDMSQYCKAYPVDRVRAFGGWTEQAWSDKASRQEGAYVFIHEDYAVTSGVFRDRDILLDDPTDEWVQFCRQELAFSVPADILAPDREPTVNELES